MSDIIQEIDEDIRKERYQRLWKQYGVYLIALCAVVVLGTAGYKGWQAYSTVQLERKAALFASARAADTEAALATLNALAAADDGFGMLARWQRAGLLARAASEASASNNDAYIATAHAAADAYNAIAAHSATPPWQQGLARLLALNALAAAPPDDWQQRIASIVAAYPDWQVMGALTGASIALQQGERSTAQALLEEVADTPDPLVEELLRALAETP